MCRFNLALFVVGALWSLHPTTRGDDAKVPSEGKPAAVQEAAGKGGLGAGREQGAEQQIRDLEGQINATVVSGGLHVFERLLADDFTHTNRSGIFRTKAQWLANHKPGQSPYIAYDVDDMNIRVYGDTAVVTAHNTERTRLKGQFDHRPVPLSPCLGQARRPVARRRLPGNADCAVKLVEDSLSRS